MLALFLTVLGLVVVGKVEAQEECRPQPLGLMDHTIRDWQLAASSVVSRARDPDCAVKHARLFAAGSKAWCPEQRREDEWILVDLGVQSEIAAVMTQGRDKRGGKSWVTHYHVSYSQDAYRWEWARDIYGDKKLLSGNTDSHTVKVSYLEHPVTARFLRLHVQAWHNHPSLKMDIIGCQKCNKIISEVPYTQYEGSSHKNFRSRHSCSSSEGHIHSSSGWCPKRSNEHQWLQLDLGPPSLVTGLITKGRGDKKNWVTSYSISYSNDTNIWFYYKDANHLEAKIFGGNMDIRTERRHYLNVPMVTRYIRIHPLTWRKRIGLRAGVLGCPHSGECGPGFLRVNPKAGCVANKAFQGQTWVNDKRHTWKQWKYGHSTLAVDGQESTNLPNCAIMDNYYVDKPVFMVDLGSQTEINGAVILTWQGQGQGKQDWAAISGTEENISDKITSYTDYVYNLDRLSVYVSNTPQLDYAGLSSQKKCGVITRKNTALFNPRLHFDCPEPLKGRYVYVKATGVPNRWRKLFNVVLCEVMVY